MGKPDHSQRSSQTPAPYVVAANMKERDAALLGQSEVETHHLFTDLSLRCKGRVMGINRFAPGICPGFFIALVLAHPERVPTKKTPTQGRGLSKLKSSSDNSASIAATTALKCNHKTKNKNKQVDVCEIHAQSTSQVLIIPVSARHRVKVHEGHSHEHHCAQTSD